MQTRARKNGVCSRARRRFSAGAYETCTQTRTTHNQWRTSSGIAFVNCILYTNILYTIYNVTCIAFACTNRCERVAKHTVWHSCARAASRLYLDGIQMQLRGWFIVPLPPNSTSATDVSLLMKVTQRRRETRCKRVKLSSVIHRKDLCSH